jgi:hypothetical protein
MEQLATLMESCGGLVGQPSERRKEGPLGSTCAEGTCSLAAFDAFCTLSEFLQQRGNVSAALKWARRALHIWFAATTVGRLGDGIQVSCAELPA